MAWTSSRRARPRAPGLDPERDAWLGPEGEAPTSDLAAAGEVGPRLVSAADLIARGRGGGRVASGPDARDTATRWGRSGSDPAGEDRAGQAEHGAWSAGDGPADGRRARRAGGNRRAAWPRQRRPAAEATQSAGGGPGEATAECEAGPLLAPGTAMDVALRYLATRPRSEQEVRTRLRRAGALEATVDVVLNRLRQSGLVDDAAFAHYWVDQRQTYRPRGSRLLHAELRQHGVDKELAVAAAEPTRDSAEDDAYRAASRRAAQLRALDERAFRTRLGQFLARRGFDWDVVAPVVDRLWAEHEPS